MRFETPPDHQLQIDFGEARVPIGGERVRVYLFATTLSYPRRVPRRSTTALYRSVPAAPTSA